MLCNVADVPELCNFILPAVHRATRSPSPSRPAAPRRRSRSGCGTRSPSVDERHVELAEQLRELRP